MRPLFCAALVTFASTGATAAPAVHLDGVRAPWRFFVPAREAGAFEVRDRNAATVVTKDGVTLATVAGAARWRIGGGWSAPQGARRLPTRAIDLHGAASSEWRMDLPTFAELRSEGAAGHAALSFITAPDGVKYSIVLPPGAPARHVGIEVEGVDSVRLDGDGGRVFFESATQRFEESGLKCAQLLPFGVQLPVTCTFTKPERRADGVFVYGIDVRGAQPGWPVLVDPYLHFSSFIGGPGPSDVEHATSVDVDLSKNLYIGGRTATAAVFPSSVTPLRAYSANTDGFLLKLDPAGTIEWALFLGGAQGDHIASVSATATRVAVTGVTDSPDFPLLTAYDSTQVSTESFVAMFNAAGALQWSTYLGGEQQESATGIDLGLANDVVVVGYTKSSMFPKLASVKTTIDDDEDGYAAKFTAAGAITFSSTLGGIAGDFPQAVRFDPNLNVVVTGWTESADFPKVGGLGGNSSLGLPSDMFAMKIGSNGGSVLWSFLSGVADVDEGRAILMDTASTDVFLAGVTFSSTFISVMAADTSFGGASEGWVARVKGDGSTVLWSTFLGGAGEDSVKGLGRDDLGNVYAAGNTTSADFPMLGHPDSTLAAADAFVARIKDDGTAIVWSTLVGGQATDEVSAVTAYTEDQVWIVGTTTSDSTSFPLKGGFDSTFGAPFEGFVAHLRPDGSPPVAGTVSAYAATADTVFVDWSGFFDPESGVSEYLVAIGDAPDSQSILVFSGAGLLMQSMLTPLPLKSEVPYYATVYALNGAGVPSAHISSEPFSIPPQPEDAGVSEDAGMVEEDAGIPDAGEPADAGTDAPDAGIGDPDAGTTGPDVPQSLIGWSCSALGSAPLFVPLFVVLAALRGSARTRRRS